MGSWPAGGALGEAGEAWEAGEAGEAGETAQHTDSCAEGCSQPACSCAHTPGRSNKHSPASLPWEQGPDPQWSHPSGGAELGTPLRAARGPEGSTGCSGGHGLRGAGGLRTRQNWDGRRRTAGGLPLRRSLGREPEGSENLCGSLTLPSLLAEDVAADAH